jgi:DNA-binding SARP family transcriptional activator/TolB-like protein
MFGRSTSLRPEAGVPLFQFRMLGEIALTDVDGREVDALLRQPRQVTLLAYLALPSPGTWHRRDSVLALFWPDMEPARARAALRTAVYTLRRHLSAAAVRSRGDEELSLDPSLIQTDVDAMRTSLGARDYAEVLRSYAGDLLPGILAADSPELEQWLSAKRLDLRLSARKAAGQLADRRAAIGDLSGAIDAARAAVALDPDDEPATRRWISLLDRAGDRAQAFAVYERFKAHIGNTFGVRPSAETMAVIEAIRTRRAPPALSPPLEAISSAVTASVGTPPSQEATPARVPAAASRRRWSLLASTALAIGLVSWVVSGSGPRETASGKPRSLVVLSIANATGDPDLDYVASGIGDGVATRLADIGGLHVRSAARVSLTPAVRAERRALARRFASSLLLEVQLRKVGDSLELSGAVFDTVSGEQRALRTQRFSLDGIRDAESRTTADVVGTVLRVATPATPRRIERRIDPESYRLMLAGWHQLLTDVEPAPIRPTSETRRTRALALFKSAVNADPQNARAWSGMSSVWASSAVTDEMAFEDGYGLGTAAADRALALDSLEGSAWANLAYMRALRSRDLRVGMSLLRRAEEAEPSNPEVFLIRQSMLMAAHRYEEARDAARITRQLDLLAPNYVDHEASAELCLDRPDAALALYRSQLAAQPFDAMARNGLTRTLAFMGRYDEAIESWREHARRTGDTTLASMLTSARGGEGFWRVRHAQGRRRLAALEKSPGRHSPLRVVQATFATGDTAAIRVAIDQALAVYTPGLFRLACMPDVDEFRHTPVLDRALARIGALRSGE